MKSEFHQTVLKEIEAGKIASSQRHLAELITRDPADEDAWLLLAATLNGGSRGFCLQQILIINPDNQQANELRTRNDIDIFEVVKIKPKADDEDTEDVEPRISYWHKFIDGSSQVVIIGEGILHLASVNKIQCPDIAEKLNNGRIPRQMLYDYIEVNSEDIIKASHVNEKIIIDYKDKKNDHVEVFCKDKAEATAVFNELGRHLGPRFERKSEKIKNNSKIIVAFVFFMLFAFLTLVLLFATFEISTGNLSLPLSDRSLYNLETYGPIGILLVGGISMLLTFIYMVVQYVRPPKMTSLVFDNSVTV